VHCVRIWTYGDRYRKYRGILIQVTGKPLEIGGVTTFDKYGAEDMESKTGG